MYYITLEQVIMSIAWNSHKPELRSSLALDEEPSVA